jgi:hypothetical protein
MNDENITTMWWVDERTAELVELDVPAEVAAAMGRGERVGGRGWAQRRFASKDGVARMKARVDQINARRDEMVSTWPSLKSHGRRPPGDV